MSSDFTFVEEAPEDGGPTGGGGRPWGWLVAGVALGLAVGVLFGAPAVFDSAEPPEPSGPGSLAESPAEAPVGIAEALPGFPDTLVAVVQGEGRTLSHLIWPQRGAEILRALPSGGLGEARFDASGRWLAVTTVIPEDQGDLISFGQAPNLLPLVTGVTGFAWHDTAPASLAYTRLADDLHQLWLVGSGRDPVLVTEGADLGVVVFWGYWGFALQAEEEVVLLTLEGDLKTTVEGRALASHPSGWLLVADSEALNLVSAGGGVQRLRVSTELGEPLAAALSPDFTRMVVLGTRENVVAGLEGDPAEESTITPDLIAPPSQPVWSSDSRFVLLIFSRGLWVYDTDMEILPHSLMERHVVRSVGLIPPDAP